MRDKLGMSEQAVLNLQNEMADVGQSIGHAYLKKTINVDENGNLIQLNSKEREKAIAIEDLKGDVETMFRRTNRLNIGGERADLKSGNNFEYSESGMTKVISNLSQIDRLIKSQRFNPSMAQAMAQENAIKQLRAELERLGIEKYTDGDGNKGVDIETFFNKLTEYAKNKGVDEE